MKKILILLALTFTMLVACTEAQESSNDPSSLKVGDTGTVKATKQSNGDWQFDYTDLGVSDSQALSLLAVYTAGDVEVAEIGKLKAYDEYVWDVTWIDGGGTSLNTAVDIPSGANALKPLIPANTEFVFADNDKTTVVIVVDIDGKQTGIAYEGSISNGTGELTIKEIEPII